MRAHSSQVSQSWLTADGQPADPLAVASKTYVSATFGTECAGSTRGTEGPFRHSLFGDVILYLGRNLHAGRSVGQTGI